MIAIKNSTPVSHHMHTMKLLAKPKPCTHFAAHLSNSLRARRAVVRAVAGAETEVSEELKTLEIMRKFSEQYAKRSGTYFCVDKSVTAVVIKGLAEHKEELGAPLCPCRHYDDKQAEADQGFWNCPCVPMRERKECHCMLFLTEDNDFRGDDQTMTMNELLEATADM